MATVDQLIIEILARDNGAEETLEKLHERLGEILSEAQTASKKAMGASSDAAKKTGEDIGKVGQKADETTKKIGETGKKSVDMFTKLRGAALRFIGVFALFSFGKKIVSDAMDSAVSLGKLSKASGVARQEIEALQKAGEKNFIDKETVNGLVSQISQARADFDAGKAASNEFLRKMNLAGVNVYDKNNKFRTDAANMLLEAGEYYRKRAGGDETKAIALARGQSNFSEEEARFIISMKREDYKASRDLIKTTNEQYEAQERAARQWIETKQRLEQLGRQIANKLLPILEELTKWFADFLEEISKDPEKLNELIVLFGALAVAIGLIFNPIGTAIGLFVGLMGVLYKLTNRFEFVRKAWDGMVLAIKSGINGLMEGVSQILKIFDPNDSLGLQSALSGWKLDTSKEEESVNSPTKAEANGEGNPTQYESTGETLPDYSGRSQEALGKKIASKKPSAEVASAIQDAAQKTGLSEDLLFGIAHQESGFNARAGAGTSSAKGLFQFTEGSWQAMVKKYGKQYGLTYDGVFDPKQNALAGALYMKEHERAFRKSGIEVSGASLYMGNFLGTGGAKKFFQELRKNPNASMASVWLASSNKNIRDQVEPNRAIFYTNNGRGRARSLQEVYDYMRSKSTWSGGASGSLVSVSSSPSSAASAFNRKSDAEKQRILESYSVPGGLKSVGGLDRLLDESAIKTYAKKVGTKYALDGVHDCSAYCRELLKDAIQNNPDKFEKGLVKDITKGGTAGGIIQALEKRAGGVLNKSDLDPSRIQSGTVIGMDTGNKGWDKGRHRGIDHIVYTYRDPRTGKMMVTQSSPWDYNANKRNRVGVQTMEYDKWYRSAQRHRLYGVNVGSVAKAGANRPVQTVQNTPQTPSPAVSRQPPVQTSPTPQTPFETGYPRVQVAKNPIEMVIDRLGGMVSGVFGNIKGAFNLPDLIPKIGMQPALAGVNMSYPAGAKQSTYINNSKTINVHNTVNVDARGNSNTKQIAEKTSQGVDVVSRRLARATL